MTMTKHTQDAHFADQTVGQLCKVSIWYALSTLYFFHCTRIRSVMLACLFLHVHAYLICCLLVCTCMWCGCLFVCLFVCLYLVNKTNKGLEPSTPGKSYNPDIQLFTWVGRHSHIMGAVFSLVFLVLRFCTLDADWFAA